MSVDLSAKHWMSGGTYHDTYEKAEAAAKRHVSRYQQAEVCPIYEAIAVVKSPVPEAEVTKL